MINYYIEKETVMRMNAYMSPHFSQKITGVFRVYITTFFVVEECRLLNFLLHVEFSAG